MIYDCFTFFNELELLELRLHELADVVDRFVLVEATKTHSNRPKPLYYQENRSRFSAFHDKILHVIAGDLPDSRNAWDLENHQRNCIARGLAECRPDDLVLISDLDEIPRASTLARVSQDWRFRDDFLSNLAHGALNSRLTRFVFHRRGLRRRLRNHHPFVLKFRQMVYRHFLNCRCTNPGYSHGTRMLHFRDFSCAEEMRHSGYRVVEDGGWHFSFMGGEEKVREKLLAYAHQERNQPQYTDPQAISRRLERGEAVGGMNYRLQSVPLDESFPRYLLEHRDRFASWIRPL